MMETLINSLPFLMTVVVVKVFQRLNLISEKQKEGITSVLFNIVTPALIILLMQDMVISYREFRFTLMALVAWVLTGILGVILMKLLRLKREQAGAFLVGMLSFSIGIVGYPLVSLNYSNEVFAKVVLYDLIGHFPLLMTLTYAVAIYFGEKGESNLKSNIREVITSPIIISMVVGVLFSIFGLKHETVTNILEYISSSFGFLVAALLALSLEVPKREGLIQVLLLSLLKLVSGIVVGFIVVAMFGIGGDIGKGLIIATACPASVTVLVFAEIKKLDTKLMSQFISTSLLLSLIALPVLIGLL